ncbi:exopolysaccharide biosynthesis protein [Pigmentiphaga aceris]|uniref:Exopolysaccharide biosynthesis protein n=1 Tax=Pigmentiphaga aceris TaxID=1940612 RepID=A0A5C0B275_9BURK|nr:exopolysaccharide biosynthesis protein [Pigmentiphaga aceris]QEI08016.1 exopolysaccharide biosynthesis protein [Pigmentiphaga aceris]
MMQANEAVASQSEQALEQLVEAIDQLGRRQQRVSLGDMQQEIGERSFGPFLFLPAIVELSPAGGIPGVPTLLGIIVSIFAVQMLLGRRSFWMPAFLSRRTLDGDKLHAALRKVKPVVRYMDRVVRPRWQWLTRKPFIQLVALSSIAAAASVPPLEVLPFASSLPFSAIALLGLGVITRDGVLTVAGMVAAVSALVLVAWVLLG